MFSQDNFVGRKQFISPPRNYGIGERMYGKIFAGLVIIVMMTSIIPFVNGTLPYDQKEDDNTYMRYVVVDTNDNGFFDPGEWFLDSNGNKAYDVGEIKGNAESDRQQGMIIVNTTVTALQQVMDEGYLSSTADPPILIFNGEKVKNKVSNLLKLRESVGEGDKITITKGTLITLTGKDSSIVHIRYQKNYEEIVPSASTLATQYRVSNIDVSAENHDSDEYKIHDVTCSADTEWINPSQTTYFAFGGIQFSSQLNVVIRSPFRQYGLEWRHRGDWSAEIGYSGTGYGGQEVNDGNGGSFDLHDYDAPISIAGEILKTPKVYAPSFGILFSQCHVQVDILYKDGVWWHHTDFRQDSDSIYKNILIL